MHSCFYCLFKGFQSKVKFLKELKYLFQLFLICQQPVISVDLEASMTRCPMLQREIIHPLRHHSPSEEAREGEESRVHISLLDLQLVMAHDFGVGHTRSYRPS